MIKRIFIRLTILAILLVFITPNISLSAQERRIALVIGNGAYKSSPLRNPVNDANDIANALRDLGFSVILKTNANQRTMKESIRGFGKKLRLGGVGLFYFAGHGLQVKGQNFLIPIGTNIESEADIEYEAVYADRVLAQMEDAANNLNIVILDACRDNPFTRSFRSGDRGLAKMAAPKGSLVAYATAPGSVAADGEGRNGIYTKYLLKYISNPNLKVEEVLKQVRIDVINETNEKQVPWESSSLTGDFYFAFKRGIVVAQGLKAKSQYSSELEKEIGRDGTLIAYATGVVYDKNTGLEWIAGPDKNTTWYEAKKWVESLHVVGGGWRMPTRAELKFLYKKGAGSRNMTPLLWTTGWWVWSGETKGSSSAWGFSFRHGLRLWHGRTDPLRKRAFAVRSRR